MMAKFQQLLIAKKYETLLCALILHLFIAVLFLDLSIYTQVIWPANMIILGLFSLGVFAEKSKANKLLKNFLFCLVILFPALLLGTPPSPALMIMLSICYVAFYTLIFNEVLKYLIRPSYINQDLVLASICGYLLLVEIGIFSMHGIYYFIPGSFRGVDSSTFTTVYLDMVYFCSITVSSIGFGDITPHHHVSKIATSILGIAGQFYSVVLVGIIISKYTTQQQTR